MEDERDGLGEPPKYPPGCGNEVQQRPHGRYAVVREKNETFTFDNVGGLKDERVTFVPPEYPLRHVVDGVALVTLKAADFDALVSSSRELALQSHALAMAAQVVVDEERERQRMEQLAADAVADASAEPAALAEEQEREPQRLEQPTADLVADADPPASSEPGDSDEPVRQQDLRRELVEPFLPKPTHKTARPGRRRKSRMN